MSILLNGSWQGCLCLWGSQKTQPVIYSQEEAVVQCGPVLWVQALGLVLVPDLWAQLAVAAPQVQGGQVRHVSNVPLFATLCASFTLVLETLIIYKPFTFVDIVKSKTLMYSCELVKM